jgi:hypothetical protein
MPNILSAAERARAPGSKPLKVNRIAHVGLLAISAGTIRIPLRSYKNRQIRIHFNPSVSSKCLDNKGMANLRLHKRTSQLCALVSAVIVNLPILAHAQVTSAVPITARPVPVIPEPNPALVLIPFFVAVLLFSSRHLLGARARKTP